MNNWRRMCCHRPGIPCPPTVSPEAGKTLYGVLGNCGKELAASLGGDDSAMGIPLEDGPTGKTAQGILVLQDQVIGNGQYLPINVGKA